MMAKMYIELASADACSNPSFTSSSITTQVALANLFDRLIDSDLIA